MKRLFLILAICSILFSCRKDAIINKIAVIPANTAIKFALVLDKNIDQIVDGYLTLWVDTTGDLKPDIKVKVPYERMMEKIYFLRGAYPNKNILIKEGSISRTNSQWVFNSGSVYVVKD